MIYFIQVSRCLVDVKFTNRKPTTGLKNATTYTKSNRHRWSFIHSGFICHPQVIIHDWFTTAQKDCKKKHFSIKKIGWLHLPAWLRFTACSLRNLSQSKFLTRFQAQTPHGSAMFPCCRPAQACNMKSWCSLQLVHNRPGKWWPQKAFG